jgi:hypothetical protein
MIRNRSKIVNKKNSKYLAVLAAMLVFSILLASCQSVLATTEEKDINRAEEAWGANLTVQGESYFKSYLEEMEQASVPLIDLSVPLIELRSDVPFESEEMEQASVPWIDLSVPLIELRSDVPFGSEEMKQASVPWLGLSVPLIELRSDAPYESEEMEQASVPLHGESYFKSYLEEMDGKQAENPWVANLNTPGRIYFEENMQASHPQDELGADALTEAQVMADSYAPGVQIRRTRLQARTFLTVYTVMSDGPGWVVFHADMDGEPGAMLKHIWVSDGISRINVVEVLEEIPSEQIYVMLHHDFGYLGLFEYPRTDPPVFVEDEMVNVLCFCPN